MILRDVVRAARAALTYDLIGFVAMELVGVVFSVFALTVLSNSVDTVVAGIDIPLSKHHLFYGGNVGIVWVSTFYALKLVCMSNKLLSAKNTNSQLCEYLVCENS